MVQTMVLDEFHGTPFCLLGYAQCTGEQILTPATQTHSSLQHKRRPTLCTTLARHGDCIHVRDAYSLQRTAPLSPCEHEISQYRLTHSRSTSIEV